MDKKRDWLVEHEPEVWPGNDPKIQEIPLPEHSKGLLKIFQQSEDDIKEILSENVQEHA